jgi:hypothetical protein
MEYLEYFKFDSKQWLIHQFQLSLKWLQLRNFFWRIKKPIILDLNQKRRIALIIDKICKWIRINRIRILVLEPIYSIWILYAWFLD